MRTVNDMHPARRQGEVNYRGPYQPQLDISPGRRSGEPNHRAWKKFQVLNLVSGADSPPSDALSQMTAHLSEVTGRLPARASVADLTSLSGENQSAVLSSEQAAAMIQALSEGLSSLQNVMEALPDLVKLLRLLAEREMSDSAAKGKKHPYNRRASDREKVPREDREWSIDDAVHIHNLCSETRRTGRSLSQATSRYLNRLRAEEDDILLPGDRFGRDFD
ncbi:hypothetical protein [Thalassospira sp. TSL5-1]|uniref:hypothetical protein n=1 Tax=Thalassospira sp. TSL5-1 TaxID=1544451 RepID=UPI000938EFBA|nr:hypothetical protein [Thalassospira sp. TSL5-1]OKH87937.1 hypothetical protein LF95_14605 [Thalassospira sp. TSL5-1]